MLTSGATGTGSGGGGGPVTIVDGGDVTLGTIADAAVTGDNPGTISAKLRGLLKWAFERMPASLGQKTMAASFPVVVASDQARFPISVQDFNTGANWGIDVNGQGKTRLFDSDGADVAVGAGAATGGATPQRGLVSLASDGTVTRYILSDTDGTLRGNLTKVGGAALTEGQKTMAASVPVVIASDQSAIAISGDVTVSAGVVVTQASSPWGVKVQNSFGNTAAVVAGGVAAATTDPALVVALSPNTPLPAGTNSIGTVAATAAVSGSNPSGVSGSAASLSMNLQGQLRVTEDIQSLTFDVLNAILLELRVQSVVLHSTLNSRDDLDRLRTDALA